MTEPLYVVLPPDRGNGKTEQRKDLPEATVETVPPETDTLLNCDNPTVLLDVGSD